MRREGEDPAGHDRQPIALDGTAGIGDHLWRTGAQASSGASIRRALARSSAAGGRPPPSCRRAALIAPIDAVLVRLDRLLHLHRLEHDDEVALDDLLPVLDGDLDDRRLHRRLDGVAGRARDDRGACERRDGGTAAGRPTARGAATMRSGRLTSRRLPATSTTTVWRLSAAAGDSSSPSHGGMSLTNSVSIHRVNTPNTPSSAVKAGSRTTLRWNGSTVGRPATSNSSRARRARSSASARSRPVTMILREERVERAADAVAGGDAGIEADAGTAERLEDVDRAGLGEESATGVLAVDAELDRVAVGLGVVVAELLALGDAELLAHEVDAGDLLRDRVLDLQARVDLEERDRAVGADEELARARADVADLAEDRLRRRRTASGSARR